MAKRIGVFAIIFFWGGATSFGSKVYQKMGHEVTLMSFKWIDFGRVLVQFASNFDALRGAFQHVIVPWICCGIFMQNVRKIEVYVLLALPLFFSSTFGFVYFAVILISCAVVEFCREKDVSVFKRLFSKSNLLLLPVTAVFVIYYIGNIFGEKPDMVGFEIINMAEQKKILKGENQITIAISTFQGQFAREASYKIIFGLRICLMNDVDY